MRYALVLILLLLPVPALAAECSDKPDPHWRSNWGWRTIDKRRCYYEGDLLPKSALHWGHIAPKVDDDPPPPQTPLPAEPHITMIKVHPAPSWSSFEARFNAWQKGNTP